MGCVAHVRNDGELQSLEAHLWGVSWFASKSAVKVGLALAGELLGLLHDLGKYSDAFQIYLRSATGLLNQDEDGEYVDATGLKGRIDHSTSGAQLVWRELENQEPAGPMVGQMLALCIASHHSGLIDCLTSNQNGVGEDNFSRRMGKADDSSHLSEAWQHDSRSGACSSAKVHDCLRKQEIGPDGEIDEAILGDCGVKSEVIPGF